MMQQWVIKMLHLGWLAMPFPLYALYNKHYLDAKQAQLLIVQTIMLLSLMLPGWLMQATRLVCTGFFALVTLDLCILEYQQFLNRYQIAGEQGRRTKQYNYLGGHPIFMVGYHQTLKKFKIKETFVIPLFVAFWIALRVRFTRTAQFGIGLQLQDGVVFDGFVSTFDGWNCNFGEFTYVSGIWLCVLLFCYWFIARVLESSRLDPHLSQEEYLDQNKYKIYLQTYLIVPAIMVLIIDMVYNAVAHFRSDGLLACYGYFKYGVVVQLVMSWGIPMCIGLFFFKKSGRFSVQSEPRNSSNSIQEMERTLDQMLKQK